MSLGSFGALGPGMNPPGHHIAFFVALIRRQVKYHPYVDPTVRFFPLVQLCSIHREHKQNVILFYVTPLKLPLLFLFHSQNHHNFPPQPPLFVGQCTHKLRSFSPEMAHVPASFFCSLHCLKYRPWKYGIELPKRHFLFPFTLLKNNRIISV